LDELVASLTHAIDALPPEKKLKKAAELANLNLSDKDMNEVFYKMLHGAPYKEIVISADSKIPPTSPQTFDEADVEDEEENNELEKEADEYKSPKGYFSLLDFVNLSQSPKIRVYLAPREVLEAIFHDSATVDDIISQRKTLYSQAEEHQ